MKPFDPTSDSYKQAVAFLTNYGAPQPALIQLTQAQVLTLMPQLGTELGPNDYAYAANKALWLQVIEIQGKQVSDLVDNYNTQRIPDWLRNVASFPNTPMPVIPAIPTLLPLLNECLFGACAIDAALVQNAPSLALRMLRQAHVVPGNANEYCPFPMPTPAPVDHRVIGDPVPGNPGWFTCGADGVGFPQGFVYPPIGASGVPQYRKYIWWGNQAQGGFWLKIA